MKLLDLDAYKADLRRALSTMDLRPLDGKTVFITGGLGLICSAVVDMLLVYGKTGDIFIGARERESFEDRYGGIGGVHFVPYDAMRPPVLPVRPDLIIHGASPASPELYTSRPVETLLANIDGVRSLLDYAKENGTQRLLYVSSSEVYGQKDTAEPFREDTYGPIDIDRIRSSYAVAKRASEMLCRAYHAEYGVDTVIVRPGHIYGPTAKAEDKRVSSDFAFRAAAGQDLVLKSAGLQKRSYCYAVDCAAQILTVLLRGEAGEAYNIGHDEVTTIGEMAQLLAKAGGVALQAAEPTAAERAAFNPMDDSSLDNGKVKRLGYRDSFTVEEGLTHTVAILKALGLPANT